MKITDKEFCVFILSYGRADNVRTYQTLKNQGYTGRIIIVCSTDDEQVSEYRAKYKGQVRVFDKGDVPYFDMMDNFYGQKTVIYARNYTDTIASSEGITHYIVLDDDYSIFRYTNDEQGRYLNQARNISRLDTVFQLLLDYFLSINIKVLAIAQGGDFIGGEGSGLFRKKVKRKSMNFFLCATGNPLNFVGRMNDDVNTYVRM